ncbi:Ger(x)C family spore germination protein [Lysinibacillus sp. SGAir0095]|uniref:Ger(x)C family spore germination protein n=1 Tax=Lysinibacillus sp. SGAir0095 TaxID=2070463 RepID=UPI0010CD19CA|nr:Ger(x)C family spore germination protein [Lysinibacillus sp. SGAir0095]QCR32401.1 Ger(x)C family spore germination protein [Lysinibacillus sp. SGAir0095]
MKKINLIFLVGFLFILSGCWDLNENERMYYAHGAAIDYNEGFYEVYVQIISFSNVAKSEQVNQDVIQSEVNSFRGITLSEAFGNLYNSIDEEVYWGHFSFLILSENTLKDSRLNPVINDITRFIDTRYNTWVYSTDEPLSEFLTTVPLLRRSITLTRLADPLNSFKQQSFIEPVTVRKLIISLNDPPQVENIPYIRLKMDWDNQKKPSKSIETAGVGILSTTDFKGFIKEKDAEGLKWLSNKTISARVTSTLENNKYFSSTVKNLEAKIEPIVNGSNIQFDINISITAGLDNFTGNLTPEDIEKGIVKQIKKEIKDTFKIGLEKDVDIYRLTEVLYRKHVKVYKKLEKDGKVKLTDDSIRNINIDVQKIDTGRKSFEDTIK